MVTVTFDTSKFANRLKAAGVPEKQAEAEAEVLAEVLAVSLKELATKGDLKLLEASLRQQMAEMRQQMAEMRQQMAEMKTDLIKWVVGIALAQISLLVGILIKLL
jgi:hypothetical protein